MKTHEAYQQKISELLGEINITPPGYRGPVVCHWFGAPVPQFQLCSDISFYIFKMLGGTV